MTEKKCDIKCPVCDENLVKATHDLWDYDCPRCQRAYRYEKGYLYSKFETVPRTFKIGDIQ